MSYSREKTKAGRKARKAYFKRYPDLDTEWNNKIFARAFKTGWNASRKRRFKKSPSKSTEQKDEDPPFSKGGWREVADINCPVCGKHLGHWDLLISPFGGIPGPYQLRLKDEFKNNHWTTPEDMKNIGLRPVPVYCKEHRPVPPSE